MSVGIVVRPQAQRDLDDLAVYLAEAATPAIGYRLLENAKVTFDLLARYPHIGWQPNATIPPRLAGMRVFSIEGYEKVLVLYRPSPDGVEILRVVHGARDLRRLLRRT